ncbi:MAG: rod shape-determining protein RodA [Bacteroidales bacterium]|nr:rod shape-determining protein RodA [Bacteroidales bacterium]HOL98999.1 rod shape-determining protein RodA [Bacteroidales bacterium]HOM37302.1 rod shape-determining protein RodA [Bacteroidales bacterium]HPD24802.1 rod shape-determining protein RodA [Bacteroidales bacterium]HRT00579.1 rod shape-determining protein RodA [Bacteroidales bacterium]
MQNSSIFKRLDWISILIYLLLVLIGWVNIYSAVYEESHSSIIDLSQKYGKQLIWIGAALLLALVILIIDSKFYTSFAYVLYAVGILLLFAVLIFGIEINASKSWFQFGTFRMQPVEFTKITVCLALAQTMSSRFFSFNEIKSIIKIGIILFLPILLIFIQNDTGSALVFFAFIFVLYREGMSKELFFTGFVLIVLFLLAMLTNLEILLLVVLIASVVIYIISNTRTLQARIMLYLFLLYSSLSLIFYFYSDIFTEKLLLLIIINITINLLTMLILYFTSRKKIILLYFLILLGVSAFVLSADYIFNNILQPHQQNRITEFLGITDDPLGIGYNVNQSKIAIGSGGLTGKGFLQGTQTKYNFVPEQSTDFIFCTIGEEWGLIGSLTVITLYTFLILRIIFRSEKQRTSFSRIYGYGVASILFFHVAVNIGMTVGLTPVVGIPLPFLSYGGSSLWAFTILLFIFIKLDSDRTENLR